MGYGCFKRCPLWLRSAYQVRGGDERGNALFRFDCDSFHTKHCPSATIRRLIFPLWLEHRPRTYTDPSLKMFIAFPHFFMFYGGWVNILEEFIQLKSNSHSEALYFRKIGRHFSRRVNAACFFPPCFSTIPPGRYWSRMTTLTSIVIESLEGNVTSTAKRLSLLYLSSKILSSEPHTISLIGMYSRL